MNVKLTAQQKIKLLNAEDIFAVMQKILLRENKIDRDNEHFWMLGLASNDRLLFIELVSLGGATEMVLKPMKVFRVAVMKDAAKAILVRNHPTLELASSEEERDVCDHLIQAGRILQVPIVDHLIITPHTYQSFVAIGLFKKLQASLKWVPAFEIAEKMAIEARRIRDEELRLREAALKLAEAEKKDAVKKAETKTGREYVLAVLEAKYAINAPADVKRVINNTTDLKRLKAMLCEASRSASLADFAAWLAQTR